MSSTDIDNSQYFFGYMGVACALVFASTYFDIIKIYSFIFIHFFLI